MAIAGNAQISLSWTAPTFDGGRAIDNYVVYQDGFALHDHPTGLTTFITSLSNGQSYSFTVAAHNSAGNRTQSSSVTATPATVPGALIRLTATPGSGRVDLAWQAPTLTGSSPITIYKLYRSNISGGTYAPIVSPWD